MRKKFTKFIGEIWTKELTNSETGSMFYANWKKVFELEESYQEIKNKYEILYKAVGIDSNTKLNRIVFIALIASIILNVINFMALMKVT